MTAPVVLGGPPPGGGKMDDGRRACVFWLQHRVVVGGRVLLFNTMHSKGIRDFRTFILILRTILMWTAGFLVYLLIFL